MFPRVTGQDGGVTEHGERARDDDATAEWYRRAGGQDLVGHSALHVEWALGIARDGELVRRIAALPRPHRQPSLLFSAAAYVGAPTVGWPALRPWLLEHWRDVASVAVERMVQTNEVQRCAPLAAALAAIPGPVALLELGASAGLCLLPDRWSMEFRHADGRRSTMPGAAGVRLHCEVDGDGPLPERLPSIVWRRGIDLAPRSAADPDDRRWLEACVPADRPDRVARLRAALEVAAEHPPEVVTGDGVGALEAAAADAPTDATLVIVSLGTLVYLDPHDRARFPAAARELGARTVTMEGAAVLPDVAALATARTSPAPTPFLLARDGEPLAHVAAHGDRLAWLG